MCTQKIYRKLFKTALYFPKLVKLLALSFNTDKDQRWCPGWIKVGLGDLVDEGLGWGKQRNVRYVNHK